MSSPKPQSSDPAEAAHYALLRRLAPALRHDMVGLFQPINMMAVLLEKHLQAAAPDLLQLGKNGGSMKTLCRDASTTCVALLGWLQPLGDERVPLNAGIEGALRLVSAELYLRGFKIVNQTAGQDMEVAQSMLRHVFLASLIALTDSAQVTADLLLTAKLDKDELVLVIALTAPGADGPLEGFQAYRALDFNDAQALADAEGVSLQRGPNSVSIVCRSGSPQSRAELSAS